MGKRLLAVVHFHLGKESLRWGVGMAQLDMLPSTEAEDVDNRLYSPVKIGTHHQTDIDDLFDVSNNS